MSFVDSLVVSTGFLSEPGVTPTEFISRAHLDSALKVVQQSVSDQVAQVLRLLKGKEPASTSEPTPPPPPPPPPP